MALNASKDNVVLSVLFAMILVLSFTSITAVRTSQRNGETLKLVKECVLPAGSLCKGNPDTTQKLIDAVVTRVNQHTDQVVGAK